MKKILTILMLVFTVSMFSQANTEWTPSGWSNGVPTTGKNVTIQVDYNTTTHGSFSCKTLTIATVPLTPHTAPVLTVTSNHYVKINKEILASTTSNFIVQNNGSVIQETNDTNIGSLTLYRTANIDFRDYVYWSTPVTTFHASNISTTSNNANLYKWIPTVVGNGAGNFGNWTSGNETMIVGLGYIERGLNSAPLNAPVDFTTSFNGVPNNGDITVPISRGTYVGAPYSTVVSPTQATQDDDNWNLLGNPYPSAISADAFLIANATNLDGYVKIWRHGLIPSTSNPDPFYNNYAYNYSANDYLTYNLSGPSFPVGFDGYIASCQGFIVKMLPTSPLATTNAVFNNGMRNTGHRNDQFYKNASVVGEGRIWLNLVSSTETSTSLIAYVDGATNGKDQMYDAQADLKSPFNIYSLLEGYDRNLIQGRTLPFNQDDQVPLGIKIPANGDYTIGIQTVDGIFTDANQNIYLEDRLLNVIHDLRSAPYHFTSNIGEYIERFVLRYSQTTLSTPDFVLDNTYLYNQDGNVVVKNTSNNIKNISVYDMLGRQVYENKNVDNSSIVISNLPKGVLIFKINVDGVDVTKKHLKG